MYLDSVDEVHEGQSIKTDEATLAQPASASEGDDHSIESSDVDFVTQAPFASDRDNEEFHRLFPIVPDEERLIDDYNHVGFKGWTSTAYVCKHYAEIKSIEKRNVALVIPNAIELITPERTYFLASFLQRDVAFDMLTKLWEHHNPTLAALRRAQDGADNANSTKDADSSTIVSEDDQQPARRGLFSRLTRKSPRLGPADGNVSDNDGDRKSDERLRPLNLGPGLFTRRSRETLKVESDGHDTSSIESTQSAPEQAATLPRASSRQSFHDHNDGGHHHREAPARRSSLPPERTVRECDCMDKHSKMITVMDKTYAIDIADLWKLWFGVQNGGEGWFPRFLCEERNLKDLQIGTWVAAGVESVLTPIASIAGGDQYAPAFSEVKAGHHRKIEYIMPLNASLGPKQTKCLNRDEILNKSDSFICIQGSSITPDVPSGGAFTTVNRICLQHAGTRQTRVIVSGEVSWSKSSWLKAAIDKGVIEGMRAHNQELDRSLAAEVQRNQKDEKDEGVKDNVPASVIRPPTPKSAAEAAEPAQLPTQTSEPPPKPPRKSLVPSSTTLSNASASPAAQFGAVPITPSLPLFSNSKDLPLLMGTVLAVFFMLFLTMQTLVLWKLAGVVERMESKIAKAESVPLCVVPPLPAAHIAKWEDVPPVAVVENAEQRVEQVQSSVSVVSGGEGEQTEL
ncbi:hypothetical protein HDV00_003852 [Rhizophlyctis rosea]|nr:hypothetical protein HDV00_003852 [Rhizophlyctis rosea]